MGTTTCAHVFDAPAMVPSMVTFQEVRLLATSPEIPVKLVMFIVFTPCRVSRWTS